MVRLMPTFQTIRETILVMLVSLLLLGCSPQEAKIESLLQQLVEDDTSINQGAFNALLSIGEKASPATVMHLKAEKSPWKQHYYLEVLAKIGTESITKDLAPLAKSEDPSVREFVIELLTKFGNQHAIEPLIESLSDQKIEESIKEMATKRLQTLTGQNHLYKADMTGLEKIKTIRAWHIWWRGKEAEA